MQNKHKVSYATMVLEPIPKGEPSQMLTEQTLRDYPDLVKVMTGVPADDFWTLMAAIETEYPTITRQRTPAKERQRAPGGGRPCDLPLVIRVAMLLFYLRTHVPQWLVALLFGATQSDVSRDLRRILPVLHAVLPSPAVWDVAPPPDADDATDATDTTDATDATDATDTTDATDATDATPAVPQVTAMHVLVDATEQEVARSQERATRKKYYSGKQKAFTLKTQLVTDDDHTIIAISVAVPGTMHDKKLCDAVETVARLPDGATMEGDKGYQGLAAAVDTITVVDATTGETQEVARVTVRTPIKKPRGGELTTEQQEYNRAINAVRVRVEHCIGWAKNWRILATQFRCSHTIYTSVMQAVCGFVNLQTQRWQAAKQAEAAYCA